MDSGSGRTKRTSCSHRCCCCWWAVVRHRIRPHRTWLRVCRFRPQKTLLVVACQIEVLVFRIYHFLQQWLVLLLVLSVRKRGWALRTTACVSVAVVFTSSVESIDTSYFCNGADCIQTGSLLPTCCKLRRPVASPSRRRSQADADNWKCILLSWLPTRTSYQGSSDNPDTPMLVSTTYDDNPTSKAPRLPKV